MHKINITGFDLNLLSIFVMLWETRSVTRASDRLALTQPAVSHALRRLRDAVGDDLFVNAKGGLLPTARAEALIGPVREALEKIGLALQGQEAFVPSLAVRQLNIAAGDLVEFSIVPQLVEHLGKVAPGIVVRMHPVSEGDLALAQLESGQVDAIVGSQPLKGMGVHNETLAEITIATLVWKQEKLRSRRFPLDLYLKRPHVIIQMPPRQESIVDQTLANLGLQRPVGAVVQNFMAMPIIAARTGYICNVPSRLAGAFAERFGLSAHEPPVDFSATPLYMSWHKRFEADPAHAWLMQQIRDMAQKPETGGRFSE
ncbi:LysR family transcriptional regulator [Caballeronia arationis]|jgi:DNA-binding transcriptional LysR family regulator|uniref:LysR family transcriptional regulator n=1 Tax=Caballeronia arationis TaxID=1777142 RepID=UPI00074BDC33|nr:LysR family transcriptional regulator [Caballeronia arationis]SAK51111.1 LysR family transcriptional regulator [Caballeronia arationis]